MIICHSHVKFVKRLNQQEINHIKSETRDRQYINLDANGIAKISSGYETVKEQNLCEKCWIKRFNGYNSIRS